MTNGLFISYRRQDYAWSTRALHDALTKHFGADSVFMDVDAIDYGADFVDKIEQSVGRCDVVIAVIGPNWLTTTDEHGKRRLDDSKDYVRLEIGMGLKRRISVIPVLVDGAKIPRESDLPDDLKALSRRNAIELRHSHFVADTTVMIESLSETLSVAPRPVEDAEKATSNTGTKIAWIGVTGTVGAAVIAGAVALYVHYGSDKPQDGSDVSVLATDGTVAVGGDIHVGGDLTITRTLDPANHRFVQKTVDTLAQ